MKVSLHKFGLVSDKNYAELFKNFEKKLKIYTKVEVQQIKDTRGDQKREEAFDKIREKVDFLVLLDERGKQLSSREQAKWLGHKLDNPGIKSIGFCVGNAHGFSENQRQRANYLWSFSKAVFPNELAWVMLAEQIYRSFAILSNSPYHHD